jgi:hypothetical protein
VEAFRLTDGHSVFSYPSGSIIFGSAAVSTGQFFITNGAGKLFAFGQ